MKRNLLVLALLTCLLVIGFAMWQPSSSQQPKSTVAPEPTVAEQLKSLSRRASEAENRVQSLEKDLAELKKALKDASKEIQDKQTEDRIDVHARIDKAEEHTERLGVPLGAMIAYFGSGKQPPKGYVWADGKTNWPKADWVPVHLQGKKIPDMQEHLVGGAKDETGVGATFSAGSIGGQKLTPDVILSSNAVDAIHPNFLKQHIYGMIGVEGQGLTVLMDFLGARRTFARIPQHTHSISVQTSTLPTTKLDNANTNPRHVMCRWIIRMK